MAAAGHAYDMAPVCDRYYPKAHDELLKVGCKLHQITTSGYITLVTAILWCHLENTGQTIDRWWEHWSQQAACIRSGLMFAALQNNTTRNSHFNIHKLQTLYCVPVRSFWEETSSSTSYLSDDDVAECFRPTDSCARFGRVRDLRFADGSSRFTTSTSAISFMFWQHTEICKLKLGNFCQMTKFGYKNHTCTSSR